MKSANFKQFLWSLITILTLGSFSGALGMDEIFEKTSKPYSTPNWNVPAQPFPDNIENGSVKLSTTFPVDNPDTVRKKFSTTPWLKVDQACIAHQGGGLGTRTELFGSSGYMYPLQYAIETRCPLSTIQTILKLGSPKAFKGYDPFRHIVAMAISSTAPTNLLLAYTDALIAHGMSPDANPVGFSSTEQAFDKYCANESARFCVNVLTEREGELAQHENAAKRANALKLIKLTLDQYKPPVSSTSLPASSSTSTSSVSTPATVPLSIPSSTSTTTSAPSLPGGVVLDTMLENAGRHQLAWHETVTKWCRESKSGFAKKTACIVALACVAVATKLLYNRLFAQHTQTPSQIIITNKSGSTIRLGYMEINSNTLTSVTLKNDASQALDMNKIKPDIIVTGEHTIKKLLPIDLAQYKASVHQKNTALHITIGKNSGLRSWLSGKAYTYTATWQ